MEFNVAYPERLSRGTLLLKTFFGWAYVGFTHGIILSLYSSLASIILMIAWWAILFTGKFPKGLFDLVAGYYRWTLRVGAYTGLLTDHFPPFSYEESEDSPVTFKPIYPENLSRGTLLLKTFFGWAYVGIPHGLILGLYGSLVSILSYVAWFIILFTGKYPEGMFDLIVKYLRWSMRVGLYMSLMTDEYPPFSGE